MTIVLVLEHDNFCHIFDDKTTATRHLTTENRWNISRDDDPDGRSARNETTRERGFASPRLVSVNLPRRVGIQYSSATRDASSAARDAGLKWDTACELREGGATFLSYSDALRLRRARAGTPVPRRTRPWWTFRSKRSGKTDAPVLGEVGKWPRRPETTRSLQGRLPCASCGRCVGCERSRSLRR